MSKKQEHPLLFIITVALSSVIMLILFYTNIIIFFFVFLAVLGWNIGRRIQRRKATVIHPDDELQKYITQIDNMMKER
ncbi:MAG: hypothetical protein ACFFB2_12025 [Promethearchaeota archaeon]